MQHVNGSIHNEVSFHKYTLDNKAIVAKKRVETGYAIIILCLFYEYRIAQANVINLNATMYG